MNWGALLGIAPLLVVAFGGALLMVAEAFSSTRDGATGRASAPSAPGPERREESGDRSAGPSSELALGTAITLLAGAVFSAAVWFVGPEKIEGAEALAPYLIVDRFTTFVSFILCLGAGLAALLAGGYLPEHKLDRGEFYPLLTFSTVGAMILAASGDVLSLFLGLETMSLGVYAMTGFRRTSPRSTEAAVKYFLLGSFAAALLLYGAALLYGATGHTDFEGIRQALLTPPRGTKPNLGLVVIASALILVGMAFKVSAVPFHQWTPDAYEGAPTPATGYMAVAVKTAAFAALVRVLLGALGHPDLASWGTGWPPIVAFLAVATMTVANFTAGRQESVKRMLAYSSIAHAGYVLVALVALPQAAAEAQGAVLFYLLAYTVSTIGAFGTLILCGSRGAEAVSYEDLAGLGKRHPAIAAAFSLFLLSLAGVPPTAGFFGKLNVVKASIGAGHNTLTVLLLLNSVLAAYYYLRVLVFMYMREPAPGAPIAKPMRSGYVAGALVLAGVIVLGLGIWPVIPLRVALEAAFAVR